MCGIAGFSIQSSKNSDQYIKSLRAATTELLHRGPDNQENWIHENFSIGLAHTRLSIIDLTQHGNQPMMDTTKNFVISFNGEIYNFKKLKSSLQDLGYIFYSDSDTEVLLNGFIEWGEDIFKKINGMYAVSILNIKKNILYLARDPAGQKPLYYNHCPETKSFIFGSEIKALRCFPTFKNSLNHAHLNQLFEEGYCSDDRSIFQSTFKVKAGSIIKYDLEKSDISEHIFWQADKLQNLFSPSLGQQFIYDKEDKLLYELHNLLEEAVDSHLNADVSVGMLLSGGIDSSLLVAIAAKIRKKINTYTVRFSNNKDFDESTYAANIANQFQTDHCELDASHINPKIIDELVHFYDEPIFDTSTIPTFLLSSLISKHCKVAIGGDGGDELFGGYPHYDKLLRIQNYSRWVPLFLRENFSNFFQKTLPIGLKGKKTLEFFGTDLTNSYPNTSEFFSYSDRKKIFNSDNINILNIQNLQFKNSAQNNDLIDKATLRDFNNFLREDILVKVDRASMAHSLEIRSPFLDDSILNFAFSRVPSVMKVTKSNRKILLKKLASRLLPADHDIDRKQGFSLPLKELVHDNTWRDYFFEKIQNSDKSIFNKTYALKLMDSQHSYANNAERLLALVFFMTWVERYNPTYL